MIITCPKCGARMHANDAVDIDYGEDSIFVASETHCPDCHNVFLVELQYDFTCAIISDAEELI